MGGQLRCSSGEIEICRCWFSDGGISSNFPIYLFDGLLPLWPTFGINLEPKIDGRKTQIFPPKGYTEGYGERWNLFDDKNSSAAKFGGFFSTILSTMQNWNDNTLARMSGVRDRIVRVRLNENEGGLNLDMEEAIIRSIVTGSRRKQTDNLYDYFSNPFYFYGDAFVARSFPFS
jgi:hypothetical protein